MDNAKSSTISCEKVESFWDDKSNYSGFQRGCLMNDTTAILINDTRVTFEKPTIDTMVTKIFFRNNKKIELLPEGGWIKSLPNVRIFDARNCSIKIISRKNFKELPKLYWLQLERNNIEIVNSDTFHDLVILEYIDLGSNKIKLISGEAFQSLKKIRLLWLDRNICVDRLFDSASLVNMQQIVSQKCGFDVAVAEIENLSALAQNKSESCENSNLDYTDLLTVLQRMKVRID